VTETSPGWVATDGGVQAEVTVRDSGVDASTPLPWQLAPREAVTVNEYVPGAVAAVVAILNDEVNVAFVVTGLFPKAAVAPGGRPAVFSVTVQLALLPFIVTVTVPKLAVPPAATVTLVGEATIGA
jgi:hypothetical protein